MIVKNRGFKNTVCEASNSFASLVLLRVFSVALLSATLTGCGLNTLEAVPGEAPLKLSGPTENCMSESLKHLESYFKGSASAEQVDTAFSCVSGALDMFTTYGRGTTDRDSFSSIELRTFLERHFLGNLKLSDSLLNEVMRVKIAILGGSPDRLTKAELTRLVEVLDTLRIEALRLRPYVEILNQRLPADGLSVDPSHLEQAISDFTFTMDTLGALLGKSRQTYKLENLKTLLQDFQGLYEGRSNWKGPEWFSQQMPLIVSAKALLIRPDGESISPDEWQLLFSHVGRVYGLFLRFKYAIKGRDLFFGEGLAQTEIGILEVAGILEEAIEAKGDEKISYQILRDFILALGASGSFELPVQASTISDLLEPLLEKIFNPIVLGARGANRLDPNDPLSVRGERVVQGGLTRTNLYRIRDTFLGWVETQEFWERLEVEAMLKDPTLQKGQPLPLKVVRPIWASFNPVFAEPWSDLKSIFDRPVPPSTRENGTMIFENSKKIVYDRKSFRELNWKQQVVRTIGYGYISDPEGLRMSGITLDQFEKVFIDLRQLAIDLDFLDESENDIWKTGFSISNIFLFSSNGDDRIGYHEATDLFIVSFASGVIRDGIEAALLLNCESGPLDVAGKPTYKASCWRKQMKAGYTDFLFDIPGWVRQAKGFGSGSWGKFFDNIEKASRKTDSPSGLLTSSERSRAISIHHYIESLYTRWDSNRDDRLSLNEADKSYFLFKRLLKDASGFKKDEEVRALFFYLLAYGAPPDDGDLGDIVKWLWWKSNPDQWPSRVSASREKLAQIFGNLAAEL
ncbi:MAG: hypothetical protein J0L82_03335 [Deltaproteobacteria bacterium]|nr:hypothetical protein [Deltaproteobacteria bacterium]